MPEDFCISIIALLRFNCNFIMAMNCIGRALDFSTWYVLYYLCDLSDNNDFFSFLSCVVHVISQGSI